MLNVDVRSAPNRLCALALASEDLKVVPVVMGLRQARAHVAHKRSSEDSLGLGDAAFDALQIARV